MADLSQAKLSFRNDCALSLRMRMGLAFRYEDDALFERWDWMPSAAFKNTVLVFYYKRRTLCSVVFTFERILHLEKRPNIFGNDRPFRNGSFSPKTLEILSFNKDW